MWADCGAARATGGRVSLWKQKRSAVGLNPHKRVCGRIPRRSAPFPKAFMTQGSIRIRGARQHNLQNLDLDIRTGEMTVVTGPSGSGKSSLVFDTLYAEGQRRYVATFSAYAGAILVCM